MKKCKKCQIEKSIDDFYKDNSERDFHTIYCKECCKINNRKNQKAIDLKRHYGITIEQKNNIFRQQNGCCAVCNITLIEYQNKSSKQKEFSVDHNHETGQIRGLLCSKCNHGIGLFNENLEILENVIKYLQYHNSSKNSNIIPIKRVK